MAMDGKEDPFDAALARVVEPRPLVIGRFLAGGRRVPAGNGYQWLLRGWSMFCSAPRPWLGIAAAFMGLTLVVSATPLLSLAVNAVIPLFIAGAVIACRAIDDGQEMRFGYLFAGFSSSRRGQLLVVGLLYLLAVLLLAAMVGVVVALTDPADPSLPLLSFGFLATMLFFVPLAMAFWLVPPLVVFHGFSAVDAVRSSFLVSLHNFPAFLLYGTLVVAAAVIASLPMLLGWLVLLPVLYASLYAFYRDVFFAH